MNGDEKADLIDRANLYSAEVADDGSIPVSRMIWVIDENNHQAPAIVMTVPMLQHFVYSILVREAERNVNAE
jgi:hypothetical protein